VTTTTIVALGLVLPLTPLARVLGFTPLPATYFAFLAFATTTYLVLVEWVKRAVVRRHGSAGARAART
jgi:Mg2+-importing ATPase